MRPALAERVCYECTDEKVKHYELLDLITFIRISLAANVATAQNQGEGRPPTTPEPTQSPLKPKTIVYPTAIWAPVCCKTQFTACGSRRYGLQCLPGKKRREEMSMV
jgi:hypothetical protein